MHSDHPQPVLEAFLIQHGAVELGHSTGELLAHLRGTQALLVHWQAPRPLQLAGLFHSVYGTESYRQTLIPLTLRPTVEALVGPEAERLAYLFGMMAKNSFYPLLDLSMPAVSGPEPWTLIHRMTGERLPITPEIFMALCNLTVANWLEQRPRVPPDRQHIRRDELRKMRPLLCPLAREALDDAYGFVQTVPILSHRNPPSWPPSG